MRRGWLAASVRAAAESYDGRLTVRVGDPATKVAAFAGRGRRGFGARQRRDHAVRRGPRRPGTRRLARARVDWVATGSPYAVGPGRVRTQQGGPYRVFTPFARAWREHGWADPAAAPRGVTPR